MVNDKRLAGVLSRLQQPLRLFTNEKFLPEEESIQYIYPPTTTSITKSELFVVSVVSHLGNT